MLKSIHYISIIIIISAVSNICSENISSGQNRIQSPTNSTVIAFSRDNAIHFLEQSLMSIENNISLLYANIQEGIYTMLPSGLEKLNTDPQLEQIKSETIYLILSSINVLKNNDETSEEYKITMQYIYDFITFIIAHIRWNICEIQYDAYRSKIDGWYKKMATNELEQYAINKVDYEDLSIAAYNKGKFSLLNPGNAALAPLLKLTQYEELIRSQHLYYALESYILWFYQIFEYNNTTIALLQNIIKITENQFENHMKRFTLDHILRFNGNGFIGKLLY